MQPPSPFAQFLPSLRLRFRVRRMSFLYLCFFILSFRCRLTLMAHMVLLSPGPWSRALRFHTVSSCSWRACRRSRKGCLTSRATMGEAEAANVASPDGDVLSVIVSVVVYIRCVFGVLVLRSCSPREALDRGARVSSKGTGAGGTLKGLNCATSASRDGGLCEECWA